MIFQTKEPAIKASDRYEKEAKQAALEIAAKQNRVRVLQGEISDRQIELEQLSNEIRDLNKEHLQAIAKKLAIDELIKEDEAFS